MTKEESFEKIVWLVLTILFIFGFIIYLSNMGNIGNTFLLWYVFWWRSYWIGNTFIGQQSKEVYSLGINMTKSFI